MSEQEFRKSIDRLARVEKRELEAFWMINEIDLLLNK